MTAIEYVVKQLHIPETDIMHISDERRMYRTYMMWTLKNQMRKLEWIITGQMCLSSKTSNGNTKYPHLTNIVKAALLLPHGNADVERGVSENKRLVTAERNKLGEDTINGLRVTNDMVKFSDPQHQNPESILIHSKILSAAS